MDYMKDPKFKSNLILSTYIVVLAFILLNLKTIGGIAGSALGILKPFLVGIAIAFIFNLPMKLVENKIVKPLFKKTNVKSGVRGISLILTVVTIIGLFIGLVVFVVPQLIESGSTLMKNIPDYLISLEEFLSKYVGTTDELTEIVNSILSMGENILKVIGQITGNLFTQILQVTVGVTSVIANLFMGFLIAIYILLSKEKLGLQGKKMLYAFVNVDKADKVMKVAKISHYKFSKFIAGQCIEAVILGLLCFIGMKILSIPYAVLIGTIIGVTALVPIFGALIGTVPAAFIILMVDPIKALWFIILIIVIQQLEGHLIYPFVVGHSIGLSALWVLLAITIGGSVSGILGILLGIPLLGIIYTIMSTIINNRLSKRHINDEELEKK